MENTKKVEFWADQIAELVRQRCEQDPKLSKIVKKQGYLVYDEKTPSGKIHVGSGRGWVIHDAIAKAMRDARMHGYFVLSSDDIDPLDKMNSDLPPSFKKYLGVPFRNIPSPEKGYESFADYYFSQVTDKFEEFGIDAQFESTGEQYDKGVFNDAIKTALDKAKIIQDIYKEVYGKAVGTDKLPFNPICEKCGKIGSTVAYEWNPETQKVKYECKEDFVTWAKGCGHKGEISPFNGAGKMPWKVEWAAKWISKGVVCELAGKDHFTVGGSRTVSIAISDRVYDFPPPYPSTREKIGKAYEFFNVGGKKMSTSKGKGISFVDVTKFAPAKMIRYLLVRTRPKAAIDFDPYKDNDIILLYDKYDITERVYFGKEKVSENDYINQKRIYELSQTDLKPEHMPPQIPITFAAMVAQTTKDDNEAIDYLKKAGHVPETANEEDLQHVIDRLEFAKAWINNFASDQHKIIINENPPEIKLTQEQKSVLTAIVSGIDKANTEKEMEYLVYESTKAARLQPREIFTLMYNILISKERGPRLAPFILAIGKERVKELLKKAL